MAGEAGSVRDGIQTTLPESRLAQARVGRIWALIGAAIAASAAFLPAQAEARQGGTYMGSLAGDPSATVEFQLELGTSGKRKRASFEARNVELSCDDGTTRRWVFSPTPFPFRNRTAFRGEHYFIEPGTSYETYFEVSGRLRRGGRALGTLFFISDVFDSPGAPGPNPDCSTPGEIPWTAQRVS
jgi:hypothetical protein